MATTMQHAIRKLTIQVETTGAEKAERSLRGLDGAHIAIAKSSSRAASGTEKLEREVARLEARVDRETRLTRQLEKDQRTLNAAFTSGAIDLARYERLTVLASAHNQKLAASTNVVTASQTRLGAAFAGARGYLASFVGGGIVGVGLTGMASQLGDVARQVATIGDEARRAGVSAEAFQEWKFVAEQNRIGIDQMVDGLKELNLRADEFVLTGKGSAAEAFQRLGYDAKTVAKELEDPSEMLLEIIGRLGQMDKAAQIRISDELFGGTAGERFVELLAQGEEGIRRTIDRAHDLGVVLDESVIRKAAEIDRRFTEISNTVGVLLKSAIVSAADSVVDLIDRFRELEDRTSLAGIRADLDRITTEMQREAETIRQIQESGTFDGLLFTTKTPEELIAEHQALYDALVDQANQYNQRLLDLQVLKPSDRTWTPPVLPAAGGGTNVAGVPLPRLRPEIDKVSEGLERATGAATSFADALIGGLASGEGLASSLKSALGGISSSLLSSGVSGIGNVLSGALQGGSSAAGGIAAGAGGILSGLGSIAGPIGSIVAGIGGSLLGKLFGGDEELEKAREAWAVMADDVAEMPAMFRRPVEREEKRDGDRDCDQLPVAA